MYVEAHMYRIIHVWCLGIFYDVSWICIDTSFPLLHNRYLKTLIPSFNECVDIFIGKLQENADGKQQVSMKEAFSELTLDVVGKVMCYCSSACSLLCIRVIYRYIPVCCMLQCMYKSRYINAGGTGYWFSYRGFWRNLPWPPFRWTHWIFQSPPEYFWGHSVLPLLCFFPGT